MDAQSGATGPIMLYGHAACPQVPPVRGLLARAKVPYEYVNIRKDESAAARVRAINNGNESVPTLVFPDGSTLTEPSTGELTARLEALGYAVGWSARIVGNGGKIAIVIAVAFALARGMGWF
ncbi:MAG TPA: glutaredoxin domain-containing protein [Herpetosiphonaceae bacterium]